MACDYPKIVNLCTYVNGDTWPGLYVSSVTSNGDDMPYPLDACQLEFRSANNTSSFIFSTTPSSGQGTITILDPVTWETNVPATIMNLATIKHHWFMRFTDTNGDEYTIFTGVMQVQRGIE
jgi:hypothetical protein